MRRIIEWLTRSAYEKGHEDGYLSRIRECMDNEKELDRFLREVQQGKKLTKKELNRANFLAKQELSK